MSRAIVFGGTGAVGGAVLRVLRERDVPATFTFHRSEERARMLESELGHRAEALDVTDSQALRTFVVRAFAESTPPSVAIHCAARLDAQPVLELDDDAWDESYRLNAKSAFVACRELARGFVERGGGDIVLVGALDRAQSLPVPVAFAATQGMLAATTMAIAKELGGRGVRINMVALGLLDRGLSLGLDDKIRKDYLAFSALRRFGNVDEAARAIAWLALDNRYMNGKVLPANGGI